MHLARPLRQGHVWISSVPEQRRLGAPLECRWRRASCAARRKVTARPGLLAVLPKLVPFISARWLARGEARREPTQSWVLQGGAGR